MEHNNICEKCGNLIPDGADFCPSCGLALQGTGHKVRVEAVQMDRSRFGTRPDTLGNTPLFIEVYGIIAILMGILMFVSISTTSGIWDSIADADGIYNGMTEDQFKNACLVFGGIFLGSGVCALASGFLAKRRMMGTVSLILCLVASIIPLAMVAIDVASVFLGIILMAVGLLMTNRIYVNRDSFAN